MDRLQALPPKPLCVNRSAEIDAVRGWVSGASTAGSPLLVSVIGQPGMGKSTLIVKLGYELLAYFPDGVLHCEAWNPAGQIAVAPDDLAARLLVQLGWPWREVPDRPDDRFALVRSLIAGRRVLLLVDDVQTADQILPLLGDISQAGVIVTGERLVTAPRIGRFEPLRLSRFVERHSVELVSRIAGSAVVGVADSVLSRLHNVCAGLPLTLALSAAQLADGGESPAEFIERLEREVVSATGAAVSELPGIQTVAVMCDRSYGRLDLDEARAYRWLSLIPGTEFSEDATVAVLETTAHQARQLARKLVEMQLVQESGRGYYRFHALVRQHARGLAIIVDSRADRDATEKRAVRWASRRVSALAQTISDRPIPSDTVATAYQAVEPAFRGVTAVDRATQEFDARWSTFVAAANRALELGDQEMAVVLLVGLWPFGYRVARTTELVDAYQRALEFSYEPATEWLLLRDLAGLYEKRGEPDQAEELLHRAADSRYAPGRASVYEWLALLQEARGRPTQALALLDEAVAAIPSIGDLAQEARSRALVHMHRGRLLHGLARSSEANNELVAAERYFRERERDQHNAALCVNLLGDIARDRGMNAEAETRWQEAVEVFVRHNMIAEAAVVHDKLADLAERSGRSAEAEAHRINARELRTRSG
ncbi:AAA family ATPase [Nocardia vinacea]|uniref:AAA family ATPase n=1 Tax=Nocardia vinacea TaxID=96468 RepID=UPI0033DFAE25